MTRNPICEDCCFCLEPKPVVEGSRRHVTTQLESHIPKQSNDRKPAATGMGTSLILSDQGRRPGSWKERTGITKHKT